MKIALAILDIKAKRGSRYGHAVPPLSDQLKPDSLCLGNHGIQDRFNPALHNELSEGTAFTVTTGGQEILVRISFENVLRYTVVFNATDDE